MPSADQSHESPPESSPTRIPATDGGSLTGTKPGDLVQFVVSNSGSRQYRSVGTFGINDHASVPVHLNDTVPVSVQVAGNVSSILFGFPKAARIEVGGNLINSRFEGQNGHVRILSCHFGSCILHRFPPSLRAPIGLPLRPPRWGEA